MRNLSAVWTTLCAVANWHPEAIRVPCADAGSFIGVPPRLVWHTVEGYGLPSYRGSAPHFTLSIKTGQLWQHVPVDRASSALIHPPGVETNHAHAIQVELTDAFARDSQDWPALAYARIARLARWIEQNAGVARESTVTFGPSFNLPPRMTAKEWLAYRGHCGHQHVPGNAHWDPGAFNINLVLGDLSLERKRKRWAHRLARLRAAAKAHGWTRPRRVTARALKRLLERPL